MATTVPGITWRQRHNTQQKKRVYYFMISLFEEEKIQHFLKNFQVDFLLCIIGQNWITESYANPRKINYWCEDRISLIALA